MEQIVKEAILNSKLPVVVIDTSTFKPLDSFPELMSISKQARQLGVKIIHNVEDAFLRQTRKLFVIRYGYIPKEVSSMILRKGGVIVSGK